ncbi:SusC/RagA family TonB-linked outer membrane protein [Adhaeribacter pallidiroseus]|uniref:TonB-dependent receptor SusC n=1 Tax=Adhaeribacter pallidiroseus TaxID=2072847 RepID=A0A369QHB1_9BACT|nr:TonB-dependent receptor [Adhaeribacter pallidiroseus]RDC62657.1 TonB-dependent receptor SusC [Adhaeribacter pallidiroseus]
MKREVLLTVRPINRKLLMVLLLFLVQVSLAQSRIISGTIKDEQGNALPGASIVVKGTTTGTITDANGKYSLSLSSGQDVLVASFIGYLGQEVSVGNQTTLDVMLPADTRALSEVVVTGYSTERKADLTGAVAIVDLVKVRDIPRANVLQTLQGRVPGLYVESTGQPSGQTGQVLIRGLNTLGDNSPLYIIDGVPTTGNNVISGRGAANGSTTKNVSPLQNIDPNSIESIQVLKDASAASIYGARASNGVIIVTTKQGKGKLKVQLSSSGSFQQRFGEINAANTLERGRALWQASINDGTDPAIHSALYAFDYSGTGPAAVLNSVTPVQWVGGDPAGLTPAQVPGTDWQDVVYRTGFVNSNSLTLSGGSESTTALLQFGYLNNRAIKEYSNFSKMNLRLNTSHKMFNSRLRIGENLNIARTRETPEPTDLGGAGIDYLATYQNPILPVYRTDGSWAGPLGSGMSDRNNPLHMLYINRNNKDNNLILFGNVYAELIPIDNLTIRSSLGVDYTFSNNWWIQEKYTEGFLTQSVNRLSVFHGERTNLTWTNTADYNFKAGQSFFNILVGVETVKEDYRTVVARKEDFAIQDFDFFQLDAGTGTASSGGGRTGYQLLSYFGKANYNLADKYLASVTLRYDGSSRFGQNEQFGLFPAANLGWRISNEKFMQGLSFVSNLKLRAGVGRVGNQKIGNLARFGLYAPNYGTMDFRDWYGAWRTIGTAYDINGNNSGNLASGYVALQQGNPNLKWETTDELNLGLDFGLVKDRLTGSFDYFTRNTKDILIQPPYAAVIGEGGSRWVNGASAKNNGFEISLAYQNTGGPFTYTVYGNAAHFRDKITKLPASVIRSYPGNVEQTILGHSQRAIFGYVTDGLFQNQEEVNAHVTQPGKGIGRIRYRDLNGDGKIDALDQTWLGTTLPDVEYGLGFDIGYKNFTLSAFFQGVVGKLTNDGIKGDFTRVNNGMNFGTGVFEAWSPQNTGSPLPALSLVNANDEFRSSDYLYVNGSYAKLRTLQLSYAFPKGVLEAWKLGTFRVFVMGENLFALKDHQGINKIYAPDPENPSLTYPLTRNFTFGVDLSF